MNSMCHVCYKFFLMSTMREAHVFGDYRGNICKECIKSRPHYQLSFIYHDNFVIVKDDLDYTIVYKVHFWNKSSQIRAVKYIPIKCYECSSLVKHREHIEKKGLCSECYQKAREYMTAKRKAINKIKRDSKQAMSSRAIQDDFPMMLNSATEYILTKDKIKQIKHKQNGTQSKKPN